MAKILLVEDNEMNRDMLKRRLERRGHEVSIAVDGAEGVELATSVKPDLILMDLNLPILDGWEATRKIKANEETSNLPIIALTANDSKQDREDYLQCGMNDLVPKPMISGDLIRAIERQCDAVLHNSVRQAAIEPIDTISNPVGDSLRELKAFAAKL